MASESKSWLCTDLGGMALTLTVVLPGKLHVIPWSYSFISACGDDRQVVIRFAHHIVTVTGSGLTPLIRDIAKLAVHQIAKPPRTDKFSAATGPQIDDVTVTDPNNE